MDTQTNWLNETGLLSTQNICYIKLMRPNKKISVFLVTGLKKLGRVGRFFFLEKKYNFMPFKMHKIIFFQKPEKNSRFHQ